MTRFESWSSWLYSLVSNLQLCGMYVNLWIKSASGIYNFILISKTLFSHANTLVFYLYFISFFPIIVSWLFQFQGYFILLLIRTCGLGSHFMEEENFLFCCHDFLAATKRARQRGLQPYLHPFESFQWLMSVYKRSSRCFRIRSVDRTEEIQNILCRRYHRGLSGGLRSSLQRKICY